MLVLSSPALREDGRTESRLRNLGWTLFMCMRAGGARGNPPRKIDFPHATALYYFGKADMKSSKSLKSYMPLALLPALLFLACGASRSVLYRHEQLSELLTNAGRVAYVPQLNVEIRYRDNTRALPDSQFSDTFFVETLNALLKYELSQQFEAVLAAPTDLIDSLGPNLFGYSKISADTIDHSATAAAVLVVAENTGAELVFIPYSVHVRHSTHQPKSWRTRGPSYERPISISAASTFHGQIWAADGTLLYERISVKDAGRPILYNLLGKEEPGEDIVRYAKRVYSPPMVKALYRAIQAVINGI